MSDDIINQAFNEAHAASAAEAGNEPIQQDSVESQQLQQEPETDTRTQDNSPDKSYKTLQNALDRRNRKIDRQKDELRQLRSEFDTLRASMVKAPEKAQVPDYSQYDSFEDYFKAREEYLAKSLEEKWSSKFNPSPQQSNQSSQEEPKFTQSQFEQFARQQQKVESIDKQAQDLVKQIPDFKQTFQDNQDLINELPDYIQDVILEVENPSLAVYTLINEGKFEDFANLSTPGKAAIELMRAQERGEKLLRKRITNAPAPMGGVRGVSRSSNNRGLTNSMSVEDAMTWYRQK